MLNFLIKAELGLAQSKHVFKNVSILYVKVHEEGGGGILLSQCLKNFQGLKGTPKVVTPQLLIKLIQKLSTV